MRSFARSLSAAVVFLPALAACSSTTTAPPPPAPAASIPLQPGSPWPKFRADAVQDGRSSVMPSLTGGVFWDFPTGKGVFSSPIVAADGTVLVGSADQNFYAIKPDGTLRWKVETGGIIDSSGLLDDQGNVYFGAGDGQLRAVDLATGGAVWTVSADPPTTNGAFINWFEGNVSMGPTGTLYVPNDNFFVYAVDRAAGAFAWRFRMPDQTWSLPAVDAASGALFVGNNNLLPFLGKNTFSIGPTGMPLWEESSLGSVAASPALTADGKMIVGGFDGYVRAYDAASGAELWETGTRDHVYASPALLPDGTVVEPSADGTIYAFDPSSGAILWTFDTPEPVRSSPAVDGAGNVYAGGGDGRLYVLNPDGSLRWSLLLIDQDRQNLNASPALGSDAIYLGGESGEVFSVPYDYCLRPMAQSIPGCSTTPDESLPENGAVLVYSAPFGALDFTPPAEIEDNQALAFTLKVRVDGRTQLDILDNASFTATADPPAQLAVDISGDGKFVTVTPVSTFAAGPDGNVSLTLSGNYLTDLTRAGLALSGGTVGGKVSAAFSFAVRPPETYPLPLPTPQMPGDPAGVWELSRLSLPLPTILPSYNQIGFDSLHYLIGIVEGTGTTGVAWMAGAKVLQGQTDAVIDPATQALLPLALTYQGGELTLANADGLTVDVLNALIPFRTFRMTAFLAADGSGPNGAFLSGSTICADVPVYGMYLETLGLCNPQTNVLTVFGGANLAPYGSGSASAPAGVGTVAFSATASAVTATLTGSSLLLAEHVAAILLVDAATGAPVTLSYGPDTTRTTTAAGAIATVTVPIAGQTLPAMARAYLMIDTYPAAVATIPLPG
jgi:outer membrane protein assembly factor BamB